MAYCGPRGIPYDGWLEWDDTSRAAALAWAEREADRCPGCGLHHRDLAHVGGDHRKMPVKPDYRLCMGCQAKERHPKPEGDDARAKHFRWLPRSASRSRR